MECSVWLSALVFVEMHLLHLFLQEGNGHGATSVSGWQRVNLGDKFIVKQLLNISAHFTVVVKVRTQNDP